MAVVSLAWFALGVSAFPEAARADGQYVKVDYPASIAQGELQTAVTYTLWVPEGVKTLRGLIVHQHGAGTTASKEGATAAYDLHWQGPRQKVGLRSHGTVLPRVGRCRGPLAGRFGILV